MLEMISMLCKNLMKCSVPCIVRFSSWNKCQTSCANYWSMVDR